jgi:hypothetical protein
MDPTLLNNLLASLRNTIFDVLTQNGTPFQQLGQNILRTLVIVMIVIAGSRIAFSDHHALHKLRTLAGLILLVWIMITLYSTSSPLLGGNSFSEAIPKTAFGMADLVGTTTQQQMLSKLNDITTGIQDMGEFSMLHARDFVIYLLITLLIAVLELAMFIVSGKIGAQAVRLRALTVLCRAPGLLPSCYRMMRICLRALANVSASFDCNSPVLWPTTHCGRSWVPRWPEQKPRGGQGRKLSCVLSSNAFPKMPAARPAPDRRPIPSLRSVIPQVGGQARFALKRSTASVALRSAPSPVARWDSLLLLSRTVQSALGRFLLLAPSGDGSSLSPALWGPAQTSLKYAKVLAAFASVARATYALPDGAGCECSPENSPCASANCGLIESVVVSNIFQSALKSHQGANQSSCLLLN